MRQGKPKFGKVLGGGPKTLAQKGKGSVMEMLPNRHAMSQLVKGSPEQRSLNNYAKLTPVGAGAPSDYGGIMDEAQQGVSALPDE